MEENIPENRFLKLDSGTEPEGIKYRVIDSVKDGSGCRWI